VWFPVCLFLELRHPFLSFLSFIPVFLHPLAPLLFHPSILSLVSFLCFSILWLLCFFIHSSTCSSVPEFLHPLVRLLFHPSSNSSVSSSILSLTVFLLSPVARSLLSLVCFATGLFRGVAVAVGFW
jgi:hypothetical protein